MAMLTLILFGLVDGLIGFPARLCRDAFYRFTASGATADTPSAICSP